MARLLLYSIDISPLILITISIIRRLRKRCQYEFIEFVGIKFKGNTAATVRIVIVNWVKITIALSIVLTNRLRFFLRYSPIFTSNHGYREGEIDERIIGKLKERASSMEQFSLLQESKSSTTWFFSVIKASAAVQTARLTINTLSIWSRFLSQSHDQSPYIANITKARSYDFICGCVSFLEFVPTPNPLFTGFSRLLYPSFLSFCVFIPKNPSLFKARKPNKHKALPCVVERVENGVVPTPLSCLKIVLQYAHFSSKNIQQKMFIAYIVLFGFKSFGVSIICQSENNPVVLYAIACTFYKMH